MHSDIVAIVPAAGAGQRMNMPLPKQYMKIGHATILEHTLHKLLSFPLISQVVVVISAHDRYFSTMTVANHPKISVTYGGNTRAESVFAGLSHVKDDSWVLVHDAARPCVTHADIHKLINEVVKHNCGGILATKVTDTIKQSCFLVNDRYPQIAQTHDREHLWAAATPQMFMAKALKESMIIAKEEGLVLTDEASAIEHCHGHPMLVEGQRNNIKITRQEDLALAMFYLQEQGYINR